MKFKQYFETAKILFLTVLIIVFVIACLSWPFLKFVAVVKWIFD